MKLKIYVICLLTAFGFGCKHNVIDEGSNNVITVAGKIVDKQTKAPVSGTVFGLNDKIGVSVVAWKNSTDAGEFRQMDNFRDNLEYTSDATGALSAASASNAVYPNSKVKVDLYAYYPYNSVPLVLSNGNYEFAVQADQTTEANLVASDLMVAKVDGVLPSDSAVPLSFVHAMAKVSVYVTAPLTYKGVDIVSVKSVNISNVNKSTLVNPQTGESSTVTVDNVGGVKMYSVGVNADVAQFIGIIAPKATAQNYDITVVLEADGSKEFAFTYKGSATFELGKNYQIFITSFEDERELTLGDATIANWSAVVVVNGGDIVERGADESFKVDGVAEVVTKVQVTCNDGYTYDVPAVKDANTVKFKFTGEFEKSPEKYPYIVKGLKFFNGTTAGGGGELTTPVTVNGRTSVVVDITNSFK